MLDAVKIVYLSRDMLKRKVCSTVRIYIEESRTKASMYSGEATSNWVSVAESAFGCSLRQSER